jgi:hypothetical protein
MSSSAAHFKSLLQEQVNTYQQQYAPQTQQHTSQQSDSIKDKVLKMFDQSAKLSTYKDKADGLYNKWSGNNSQLMDFLNELIEDLNPQEIQSVFTQLMEQTSITPDSAKAFIKNATNNLFDSAMKTATAFTAGEISQVTLREEVPFERWFFHFENSNETFKPRFWAVMSLAESLLRGTLVGTAWCASKIFNTKISSQQYASVFKEEMKSASLSFKAILSPRWAIRSSFDDSNNLTIGCPSTAKNWGTPYKGDCDFRTWGNMLRNEYCWG